MGQVKDNGDSIIKFMANSYEEISYGLNSNYSIEPDMYATYEELMDGFRDLLDILWDSEKFTEHDKNCLEEELTQLRDTIGGFDI